MISLVIAKLSLLPSFAAVSNVACSKGGFLGLPPWWEYLQVGANCTPVVNWPGGIWLIGLAVLDMLLRVAGLVAVISILVSSVMYVTSSGNPDRAKAALDRIISSLVGLAIVLVAAAVVAFVGNRL